MIFKSLTAQFHWKIRQSKEAKDALTSVSLGGTLNKLLTVSMLLFAVFCFVVLGFSGNRNMFVQPGVIKLFFGLQTFIMISIVQLLFWELCFRQFGIFEASFLANLKKILR